MRNIFFLICFLLLSTSTIIAQSTVNIGLVSTNKSVGTEFLISDIQTEIINLLGIKYSINFSENVIDLGSSPNNIINSIYKSEVDIVIGIDIEICNFLAKRDSYIKPTILTFILDTDLQQIPLNSEGKSGISNLVYIQSPFNLERDFRTLYEIKPFEKLGIVTSETLNDSAFDFTSFLSKKLEFANCEFKLINLSEWITNKQLFEDVDAVYVFPHWDELNTNIYEEFYLSMANRGIPSMSLLSNPDLSLGAYAAYETDGNLQRIPRRVALNTMKILDGENAKDLPVLMGNFTEDLIVNMKTVNRSELYPNWDFLSNASLLNIAEPSSDTQLTMESVIFEGLSNNLEYQVISQDLKIAEENIDLAQGNYLPQLDIAGTAILLDENTVNSALGTRGTLNLAASASLTQLIYSEPALANIAIQKLLKESTTQEINQNELDLILELANSYLNILLLQEFVKLKNENLNVTRQNLLLAKAKEQVGYSGDSDVYRWESELALDNSDLNNGIAQLNQARLFLNTLLNNEIDASFTLEDVTQSESLLLALDQNLRQFITNAGDIKEFTNFLVETALINLPEIKQVKAALAIQERSLLSNKRAFYLPTIGASAQYDQPIKNFNTPESLIQRDPTSTYNVALAVQFPIFQGMARKNNRQKSEIELSQLQTQNLDLQNKLELQVRSNMEFAKASFNNQDLALIAKNSAEKNFEIARDAYQQGVLNITSLIDAQNAMLASQINTTTTKYTFISDFLTVERSIGYFHFLANPQEKEAFIQNFVNFLNK